MRDALISAGLLNYTYLFMIFGGLCPFFHYNLFFKKTPVLKAVSDRLMLSIYSDKLERLYVLEMHCG